MKYKTIIVPVKCSKKDLNYLYFCNRQSAEVWNKCVEEDKIFYKETGKFIQQSDLQRIMKQYVPIHSKNINHVVHAYLDSRNAMFKSKIAKHENSNKVRLPYKMKKYFTTGWDYQALQVKKEEGIIKLGKPQPRNENGKKIKCAHVICHVKPENIPNNIVEIELIYTNKLCLAIKYKVGDTYIKIKSDNVASIDLGEIHSITSIDNNGNAIIITGRKIRSDKRFRNKEQGVLFKRIAKCTKGSNQRKKYMKALNNLKTKFDAKELDSVHKITKLYENFCIQNDISTVYYGDLDSCTRDTSKDHISGKVVRQKLSQWCYGLIMLQLENKLSRHGIKLIKVKEYYTSKKCPVCGLHNKPNGRNYECTCGYAMHRDVNGAINILNDNGGFKVQKYNNLKYLRVE
jgi:putative transposase